MGEHDHDHDEHHHDPDRERGSGGGGRSGPGTPPAGAPTWPNDPGAYIGHEPEPGEATIPGGVRPDDDRVAAYDAQGTGVGRPDERNQPEPPPSGHRQGDQVSDDDIRRAGDRR